MRTTTWYYIRSREGLFQSVPGKYVRLFQAGQRILLPDGDGQVRYVQLYVQWENRRPAALYGSEFLKVRVGQDGTFNHVLWADQVARMLADCYVDMSRFAGTNLIDAGCRFAERRYRNLTTWQPSARDLAALSELVRKRLQKAVARR